MIKSINYKALSVNIGLKVTIATILNIGSILLFYKSESLNVDTKYSMEYLKEVLPALGVEYLKATSVAVCANVADSFLPEKVSKYVSAPAEIGLWGMVANGIYFGSVKDMMDELEEQNAFNFAVGGFLNSILQSIAFHVVDCYCPVTEESDISALDMECFTSKTLIES